MTKPNLDFSKFIDKDKNAIDKYKLVKNAFHEPVIKYVFIGIGVVILIYASGKIMHVFSSTIKEYKNLRSVIKS